MSVEDNKLREMLTRFIEKLDNDTLTYEEKMNLVQFYIQNTAVFDIDTLDEENMLRYISIGWYVSNIISK